MSDPILRRREAALRLMAGTGIWRSNYAPPLVRLAWRLGWDLPLPHFLPAWQVVLGFGVYFGVAFTGLMWLMLWRSEGWAADRLASMAQTYQLPDERFIAVTNTVEAVQTPCRSPIDLVGAKFCNVEGALSWTTKCNFYLN